MLAKYWVRLSEDPLIGAEQKGNAFFDPIWSEYDTNRPNGAPLHPLSSAATREKLIVK